MVNIMKGKNEVTYLTDDKGNEIPQLRNIYSFEETVILSMREDKHIRLKILKLIRKYLIKREKELLK